VKTLHTAYRVRELDRSVDFYRRLGFQEIGRVVLGGGSILVMLNLPGDGEVVTLNDGAAGALARGESPAETDLTHPAVTDRLWRLGDERALIERGP
jgi:catechol 2,3-dioxygenase-like lactoylglutathione lyase family enzyme